MKCPKCGLLTVKYFWTHMHDCRMIYYDAKGQNRCTCCDARITLMTIEEYYVHFATHDWTKVIVREALEGF